MPSHVIKSMLKLSAATALCSTMGLSTAHASYRQLGADVVACFKEPANAVTAEQNKKKGVDPLTGVVQHLKSVDLLDLYEVKNNPFGNRMVDTGNQNYQQILDRIMAMLRRTSGSYLPMKSMYAELMAASVSSPGGVPDLDDANEKIVVPGNCSILQLAVQHRNYRMTLESFSVNTTLFQALSERDKAAFLVHEMVYALDFRTNPYGLKDSTETRKRVRLLFMEGAENSKLDLLSGLNTISVNGRSAKLEPATTLDFFGKSVEGAFAKEEYSSTQYFVLYDNQIFNIRGSEVKVTQGPVITKNRKHLALLTSKEDVVIDGYKIAAGDITFYNNGNLWGFKTSEDQYIGGFPVSRGSNLGLSEDGKSVEGEFKIFEGIVRNGVELKRGTALTVRQGRIQGITGFHRVQGVDYHSTGYYEQGQIFYGVLPAPSLVQGLRCERVEFYPSGKLKVCRTDSTTWKGLTFTGYVELYENGNVKAATLKSGGTGSVKTVDGGSLAYQTYQGYRLATSHDDLKVEFHSSGAIKSAIFLNEQKFGKEICLGVVRSYDRKKQVKEHSNYYAGDHRVELSASGSVVSCKRK